MTRFALSLLPPERFDLVELSAVWRARLASDDRLRRLFALPAREVDTRALIAELEKFVSFCVCFVFQHESFLLGL